MRVLRCILGIVLFTALDCSRPAQASFLSEDWLAIGDGLVTADTASGLDWLDITATTNLPYNYVNSQFGAGGQFQGWRYANDSEVTTLFNDAGVPVGPGVSFDSTVQVNMLSFMTNYIGFTAPDSFMYLQGLLDGANSDLTYATRGFFGASQDLSFPETQATVNWLNWSKDDAHWSIGSFLVRDDSATVPLPAALPLFASGLGGLGALGFWRRRKQPIAA